MKRILLLAFVPMLLSGCTTEYFIRKFMDGPKMCPSDEMNRVVQNKRGINNISNRLKRDFVQRNMVFKPDRTEYMKTYDGRVYIADYYQTTASFVCGGEGIWGQHDPVFYLGGVVVGKGENYYRNKLEHKIVDIDVVNH